MVSRHKVMLADWYSRVVFGVIAVALATLAGQGACSVEPIAHAQTEQCGSRNQPCYVKVPVLDQVFQKDNNVVREYDGLRVYVVNSVRTVGD